jgi:hypothetical protein
MRPFPSEVPLNGADYLLLAFDRAMTRGTDHGNVCHLVLELDGPLGRDALAEAANVPWLRWLASLRFRPLHRFRPAHWVAGEPTEVPITQRTLERFSDLPSRFAHSLDLTREAPIGLELVHAEGRSAVVLRWHHAMFDARGAELALTHLVDGADLDQDVLLGKPTTLAPLTTRLWAAKAARDFIWRRSLGSVSFLGPSRAPRGAQLHFRRLCFDEAQTARIEARARQVGGLMGRASFGLAVTASAISNARVDLGGDELLVPVPQDRRKRSAKGPVLGNQLNLLFYRLRRSTLHQPEQVCRDLVEQMREMMRQRLHETYPTLLDFCRLVPLHVLHGIVRLPTRGRMASFGFSDTGESLATLDGIAGVRVRDIAHYPANMHPPGITVVFTRFRGRLSVSVSWLDGCLNADEAAHVCRAIHGGLSA